jgi:hypothetical protein
MAYSSCAQVLIWTLNGSGKNVKSSRHTTSTLDLRYRGDVIGISTAKMLLKSPKAHDDSIEGHR